MANYEATRYDFSGENITGLAGVTTGSVIPWSDGSIPSGFLECNGAAVSRSTYSALFAIVGTTYGAGNGSTTFNLPDIQDDVVIGKSPTKALASTGGANTVAASGNISGTASSHTLSTPEIPSHNHPAAPDMGAPPSGQDQGSNNPTVGNVNPTSENTGGGGGHSHNSAATFSGDSSSVLQPYLTIIYIIKT